mgnify:CR=1 FL=1
MGILRGLGTLWSERNRDGQADLSKAPEMRTVRAAPDERRSEEKNRERVVVEGRKREDGREVNKGTIRASWIKDACVNAQTYEGIAPLGSNEAA